MSGISHHMSDYSVAVFVGYAAIAYTAGFTLYVWWAIGITFAMLVGSVLFAPRWSRLRQRLAIISPLEYLSTRYDVPPQQVLAWTSTTTKVELAVAGKRESSLDRARDRPPTSSPVLPCQDSISRRGRPPDR
jgi:Na+/pantothenate symporter